MPNNIRELNYISLTNSAKPRGFSISFWINTELYADLKEFCKKTGYSQSQLVRKALKGFFAEVKE